MAARDLERHDLSDELLLSIDFSSPHMNKLWLFCGAKTGLY
jgi:hypothetical protein